MISGSERIAEEEEQNGSAFYAFLNPRPACESAQTWKDCYEVQGMRVVALLVAIWVPWSVQAVDMTNPIKGNLISETICRFNAEKGKETIPSNRLTTKGINAFSSQVRKQSKPLLHCRKQTSSNKRSNRPLIELIQMGDLATFDPDAIAAGPRDLTEHRFP